MGNSWVCLVLALVACSGSGGGSAGSGGVDALGGSSGAGAPNGGAFGGGGPGGTSNGGTANSGGLAGGGGDEFTPIFVDGPAQMRGQLSIAQNSADLVNFEADVDIYFAVFPKQWDGCTRYQLGSCGYYDCPEGSNPIGSSKDDPPIYYDGGAATVTGLPPVITVSTANSNGQLFARPSQQLWPSADGNISVAVTGGSTVPAFTMQLSTPPMVRLLSLNGQAAPSSFKRSDGIKLSWSAEGSGSVVFFIYMFSGTRPAAVCRFDAAAKQGELPAAVLAHLDPGSKYYLEFRGQADQDLQIGHWTMSALLTTHGVLLENRTNQAVTLE